MVRTADPTAEPGDVVNVYDKGGAQCGQGLYNPRSQIVVRLLSRGDAEVDDAFWRSRFVRAVDLRRKLRIDENADAYRLVHAEGDGLSGLIAERYADWLVFEVFSLGVYRRYEQLAALLADVLGPPTSLDRPKHVSPEWNVLVRADHRIERLEGFRVPLLRKQLDGAESARVVIREHGVRYRVDMDEGHKTGFFCDQRENRKLLTTFCRDADVLDLCCYTGGFALNARLRGDARAVTGVDLDEAAIAVAKENANLNNTRVDFVYADAFTYIRQMLANQRQFDVVVLDPPKLAVYREQLDEALQKYNDMNSLAMQVVRPGGVLLTCSCSGLVSLHRFREVVHYAARRAGRELQLIAEMGAAPDHPVMMSCPESAYLKALWFRVL